MSLILICWSVKHVIMISSGLNMHAKKLQMFVFLIFYIVNYFKIYAVKTKIINFAKFFSEFMRIDRNTGLVLEGGGMRGVFTSGVLDGFMKHDMYFHYVVAVSAGACNGMSYMSRQIRRARISNIDYLSKYKYIVCDIWLRRVASSTVNCFMTISQIRCCLMILKHSSIILTSSRWLPPTA